MRNLRNSRIAEFFKKHKKILSTTLLISVLTMMLFSYTGDPDFGWHYKYGEYMVTNNSFLHENIFSFTMTDYLWANSYWVSQIIIFALYKNFGPIAFSLILSVLFATYSYIIFQKAKTPKIIKTPLLFFFILVISRYMLSVRPFYFSSVCMLTLIYVLLYNKKLIKYLPLLFLAWVNMHADFMLGIFVLGAYTLFQLIKDLKAKKLVKTLATTAFFPLLSLVATLINPYGIKIWTTMFAEIGNSTQFTHISEWVPFSSEFNSYTNISFFIVTSLLLGLLIHSSFMVRKKFGWWLVLVNLVFLVLSIRAKYFMRIFLVTGIFTVLEFWGQTLEEAAQKISKGFLEPFVKLRPLWIIIFVFIAIESFARNFGIAGDLPKWASEDKSPYEAVQYIKKTKPEGNMFNQYGWGGYLIWQLPEYKTFIDGRMASWNQNGVSPLDEYVKITNDPEENYSVFERYVEKYNITWILLKKENELVKYIKENKSGTWYVGFENGISTILLKKSGT